MLAVVFSVAVAISSCSDDDKEESFDTPITPGVIGGGETGDSINPMVKGLRLSSIEHDYGNMRFRYDDNGNLLMYTGIHSGWLYNVSYNPFEIECQTEGDKVHLYNVKFTKEGYIKSFTVRTCEVEEDYNYNYEDVANCEFIYKNEQLVKIVLGGSWSENDITADVKGNMILTWNNGNIESVNYETVSVVGNSYKSVASEVRTIEYDDTPNYSKQFTPGMEILDTDYMSPLVYLGFFGKPCDKLPSIVNVSDIFDEAYGAESFKTEGKEKHSYEYEFNEDNTLYCVYDEYSINEKEWENGVLIYDDSDWNNYTHVQNYYYHYSEAAAEAAAERCAKSDVKRNHRKGLFGIRR